MDYLHGFSTAMDRSYYHQLDSFGDIYHPAALHDDGKVAKSSLGPRDLGMSANPFQSQLIALQAKIREGASSIEFQFPGRGKGNSQASTPESYGYDEREAMRQLAEYNDVKTTTHATFSVSGLAGWGQNGFDKNAQHQNVEEVRKAIDFASQASTGGAIVVHTGEWHRPMSEAEWAKKDFGEIEVWDPELKKKVKVPGYLSYPDEYKQAALQVVDGTGVVIGGIKKDWGAWEPKWVLAKDYEKKTGRKLSGTDLRGKPVTYEDDDYVDVFGNKLDDTKPDDLFHRMAEFDEKTGQFKVEQVSWEELQERAKRWNEKHPGANYTPEELNARIQLDQQIIQARGQSLFHGQHYESGMKELRKFQDALAFAKRLKKELPEDEHDRLKKAFGGDPDLFIPPEVIDVEEYLAQRVAAAERNLRYIHEASASADTQAAQIEKRAEDIQTLEKYGLKQTGRALGELAVYAMDKSKAMRENAKKHGGDPKKYEDIYIAPENVFPAEYGSHPDELIKIVEEGRKAMVKELLSKNRAKSEEEAQELAKKHIKSTIDIGHLNMWKTHMVRKPDENEDQFNKRFEKWMLEKLDTMHKKGVLGHFHLTDNMGFNDEHLTPGQGNAPVRKFVEFLEKNGYKDFIIEPGSFNAATAMGESWAYLGSLQTRASFYGGPRHFSQMHLHQSGGYMPALYMVGSYVPSNEFTFWSQVPLE